MRQVIGVCIPVAFGIAAATVFTACGDSNTSPPAVTFETLDPTLVAQGKAIFRTNTFGDETYWTDTLHMNAVVQGGVSPATALAVGLKVDLDTLPQAVRDAIAAGQVNLNDPATTVTLLKLGAVLGLNGTVQTVNGKDSLVKLGITCALCHSTVDNAFAPGIGHRLDGWPNHDLNVGAIVALSPAVPASLKAILNSWGPGKYDARTNFDGKNIPAVIPPAYGLNGVRKEIYTGDDTISYWNAYVAVTQMHGHGAFNDSRLGISVKNGTDVVTPLLPALRAYQLSLAAPKPAASTIDAAAAARGQALFDGGARCSSCHTGQLYTDVNQNVLHSASEVGQDPAFAARSATGKYRTTPLRGLATHAPYFHDGSAATLADVVEHYDRLMTLGLSASQKADLVAYLKTL
jgi:mono/diheme cytochrome c family protein